MPELLQTARCSSGALSTIYLSTKSFQTAQPNPFITTINRSPQGVLLVLKSHQEVLSRSAVHVHVHVYVHVHVRVKNHVRNPHPNVVILHNKIRLFTPTCILCVSLQHCSLMRPGYERGTAHMSLVRSELGGGLAATADCAAPAGRPAPPARQVTLGTAAHHNHRQPTPHGVLRLRHTGDQAGHRVFICCRAVSTSSLSAST